MLAFATAVVAGQSPGVPTLVTKNNTNYTALSTDVGKVFLFTGNGGPYTFTLPAPPANPWSLTAINANGSQPLTVSPTSGNIDNQSQLVIPAKQMQSGPPFSVGIYSDGTNYWTAGQLAVGVDQSTQYVSSNTTLFADNNGALVICYGGSDLVVTLPSSRPPAPWKVTIVNCNPTATQVFASKLNEISQPLYLSLGQSVDVYSDGTGDYMYLMGSGAGQVVEQTSSYTVSLLDTGTTQYFNTSGSTATLPSLVPNAGWTVNIINTSSGNITVSPNGHSLNGSGSSLTLGAHLGITVLSDSINYYYVG
jgi:hypothetical protein